MTVENKTNLVICIGISLLSLAWYTAFNWAQMDEHANASLIVFGLSFAMGLKSGLNTRTNMEVESQDNY